MSALFRFLRSDLRLTAHEGGGLLFDPVTGRELSLSPVQMAVLEAVDSHADLEAAAAVLTSKLGMEVDSGLLAELLALFGEMCLLSPAPPEDVICARQREAKRRQWAERRLEKLDSALLAWQELPYYASLAKGALRASELLTYPILDKATLRARWADFFPESAALGPDVVRLSTSGTAGERLPIVRSLRDWEAGQTYTWALNRTIAGALPSRYCKLTTPHCGGTECHLREMSREERTRGESLVLESYPEMASLPRARVEKIAREMVEHEPVYILADPAYLAILIDHARRYDLPLPRPRFVVTSYERSSALHVRAIAEALSCPVYDAYGASELGAMIVQCEMGSYHVNPESFLLELLPHESGAFRMVVTALDKRVMPLLRYDTGDLALPRAEPCSCPASESDVLASLEGRSSEVISAVDGRLLTVGAVDRCIAEVARGVVTYSLVQEGADRYRLEVLASAGSEGPNVAELRDAVCCLVGERARIRVERCRELLPGPSGKFVLAVREGPW